MPSSLERFSVEQMRLLLEDMDGNRGAETAPESDQVVRIVIPFRELLTFHLVQESFRRGHHVCCGYPVLQGFTSGFLYGWKARERLAEMEALEASLGIRD